MTQNEQDRQKYHRILHALREQLWVTEGGAILVYRSGVFDTFTMQESLIRIGLLREGLGRDFAKSLITLKPKTLSYPLEHLQARLAILCEDGHSLDEARRILVQTFSALLVEADEFSNRHQEFVRLLPDPLHRHRFVQERPHAYLMPAEHLQKKREIPWINDVDAFWHLLCHELPDIEQGLSLYHAQKTAIRGPTYALHAKILADGGTVLDATAISARFYLAFGQADVSTYAMFRQADWTPADIRSLVRKTKNPYWIKCPQRLPEAERTLREQGIETSKARWLVLNHHVYAQKDPACIGPAIQTFRELGFSEELILRNISLVPPILFRSPDEIRAWHKVMIREKRKPESHLRSLAFPKVREAAGRPKRDSQGTSSKPPEMTMQAPPPIQKPVERQDPEPSDLGSSRDLRKLLERILRHMIKDWDDVVWEKFQTAHPELWDRHRPEPQAFDILLDWIPISEEQHKKARTLKFYARLAMEPDLYAILRLPHSEDMPILQIRLNHTRTYLTTTNLIDHPELLLRRWETLDRTELRFRCNEITSRGKEPHRPDFLELLFAPTREVFTSKLDKLAPIPSPFKK